MGLVHYWKEKCEKNKSSLRGKIYKMQRKLSSSWNLKLISIMLHKQMCGCISTIFFGMFKLMRWTDPSHSTMRLFMAIVACPKYVLFPIETLPCSNAMKFHVFVLHVWIGFQVKDARTSFMSVHGHWKGLNLVIV
jgi:hypothetical protein